MLKIPVCSAGWGVCFRIASIIAAIIIGGKSGGAADAAKAFAPAAAEQSSSDVTFASNNGEAEARDAMFHKRSATAAACLRKEVSPPSLYFCRQRVRALRSPLRVTQP